MTKKQQQEEPQREPQALQHQHAGFAPGGAASQPPPNEPDTEAQALEEATARAIVTGDAQPQTEEGAKPAQYMVEGQLVDPDGNPVKGKK